MIKINFTTDEDTVFVLQLISKYLEKYFDYSSDEEIVIVINEFYSKMKFIFPNETERDFLDLNFHHDHPFLVAAKVHFQNDSVLQQKYSDVVDWLRDINWFDVPGEAQLDYMSWSNMGEKDRKI